MSSVDEAEATDAPLEARTGGSVPLIDRAPRAAAVVFAVVVAIAFVLYLRAGRDEWFYLDEWDFLVTRDGADVGGLLQSHNEHWTTLPILAYRVMFNIFGLRTYVPYLVLAIVVHLAAAVVLRVIIRRAGVGPWIATAAAGLFALFGAGEGNILRGFQITFSGALLFGLLHLMLMDHDGPVDWRDWVGLLAGLAALMCSGLGVAMIVAVGLAAWLRRGWRVAALHTVPLVLIYGLWWWFEGRDVARIAFQWRADDVARFVWTGIDQTVSDLTQVPAGAFVLVVLLVVGLALAWRHPSRPEVRQRIAAPLGMSVAAMVFLTSAATGRILFGSDAARASRYVHLIAGLLLPLVAVAAAAIARRWRVAGPVMVLLFLIPIPGNLVIAFDDHSPGRVPAGSRDLMLALPHVPTAAEVPGWVRPDPLNARQVTLAWLLDGVASGAIPKPGPITPEIEAEASVRLAVQQEETPAPLVGCEPVRTPVMRRLEVGDSLGIRGGRLRIARVIDDKPRGRAVRFDPAYGQTLRTVAGPIDVRITNSDEAPAQLCG